MAIGVLTIAVALVTSMQLRGTGHVTATSAGLMMNANTVQADGHSSVVPNLQNTPPDVIASDCDCNLRAYTVAAGDTLASIASRFGVSQSAISTVNGFSGDTTVAAGQEILIPPGSGIVLSVRAAGTIAALAELYNLPVETLAQANHRQPRDVLAPGDIIFIPTLPPARRPAPAGPHFTYKVQAGDTMASVAAQFHVDINVLATLNNLSPAATLTVGQTMAVPGAAPTVTPTAIAAQPRHYVVRGGDNIWNIATQFNVTTDAIVAANHLADPSRLTIGEPLLIPPAGYAPPTATPGPTTQPTATPGAMPAPPPGASGNRNVPGWASAMQGSSPWTTYATWSVASGVYGTGTFIWPAHGVETRGFSSYHNGLDDAASWGTPIYASDSGQVIWAGWDTFGLGWSIKINHGHGFATIYGHCSSLLVHAGDSVRQGQEIALMGSTGNSTGPHVHFMIEYNNVPTDPIRYLQ